MITLVQTSPHGIQTYRLTNSRGMQADIITYGATIAALRVPDRNGNLIDVVAGFDTADEFMGEHPHFNAVIGRVGNRIDKGRFVLNGHTYQLACNDGDNHLHGGVCGFDRKMWTADIVPQGLRLRYTSPDGEENYPGTLAVTVIYSLDDNNGLHIDYSAVSDKDTLCSLTNHAYFNLEGDFVTNHNHILWIDADYLTDVDDALIMRGELLPVAGTPLDFGTPKTIGRDLDKPHRLLTIGRGGYDFNYVLREHPADKPVAYAYADRTGIGMNVYTDRPCMQVYTGNFLDGLQGKKTYGYQSAFCLETQGYPNACNVPSWPSMTLRAGEQYHTHTCYAFDNNKR